MFHFPPYLFLKSVCKRTHQCHLLVYVVDKAHDADAIISGDVVYPNPADDYLIVESDGKGPFVAEIYDLKGTLVSHGKLSSPARLDIAHMEPGVYFLKLTHGDGSASMAKFIKNRRIY